MTKIETQDIEEIKAEMAKQPIQSETKIESQLEETKEMEKTSKEDIITKLKATYEELPNERARAAWKEGWRTKDCFVGKRRDGSELKWIDYEEFLAKSEKVLPIANERIKKLTKQIEQSNAKALEMEKRINEAEKKGYDRALNEIQKKQEEAVEQGDIDRFKVLKNEEMELIKDSKEEKEVKEPTIPLEKESPPKTNVLTVEEQKIAADWSAENDWFFKPENQLIANYAVGMEANLKETKPYLSLSERLNIIDLELRNNPSFATKIYPQASSKYNLGDTGNSSVFGEQPKEKGYNDLPQEAKKVCEKIIRIRRIAANNVDSFRKNYAKAYKST